MTEIFNFFLYRPVFNLLVFIYNFLPGDDFGLAIIVLTVFIRFILSPLSLKTIRSQDRLGRLQPKIKEIQERHKNDRQALNRATMALYKEHGVNPFGGCLPILIQIPVFLALYKVLSLSLKPESLSSLYSFIQNPGTINPISFGFINLGQKSPILAVLAGIFQWLQARSSIRPDQKTSDGQKGLKKLSPLPSSQLPSSFNRQMLYFFPIMVTIISWNLPTGLVIYWLVTTIFSIGEQWYLKKAMSGSGK